jgi:phenylpropionate dioxygenase-like ring-hydroxylating dioxygenase large terminal subunit
MSQKSNADPSTFHDHCWYAVSRSQDLGAKPKRIVLNSTAYVLFRGKTGIACLLDICPHRFAPLSEGKIIDGNIECPYHGWRFDGAGRCTAIPVHEGPVPNRIVRSLAVREEFGLIFVCRTPNRGQEPFRPTWDSRPYVRAIVQNETKTSLANVAENVLDPTHTLFVHKGIMRGLNQSRSTVEISVTGSEGDSGPRVDIFFQGEERQNGWLSHLLEGKRSISTGMFMMPGVVELQYWYNGKLSLVTTIYFTPISPHHQLGFAILTGAKNYGLGFLKRLVFVPAMRHIIKQDRQIMDKSQLNWEANGRPLRAMSPTDFIRPSVEAIIDGKAPPTLETPLKLKFLL